MNAKIIQDAIANIASISEELEQYCNDPKNYNTKMAQAMEQIAWDLHRKANDLKQLQYNYGL